MKFLLDANLPYSAKELFAPKHEVFHVRDIELADASDEKILAWAKANEAVLITRDLDFANIQRVPPENYHGIIVLRLPSFYTANHIKKVMAEFFLKTTDESFSRSIIIFEEGRFRIR